MVGFIGDYPYMVGTLAGLAWGGVLLRTRPELRRGVGRSAVVCATLYGGFLLLTMTVWPDLPDAWTWANLSGVRVAAAPVEELALYVADPSPVRGPVRRKPSAVSRQP